MLSFLKRDKSNPKPEEVPSSGGWLSRLRQGLAASRGKLSDQLSALLGRHAKIDESLYEELETLPLSCDIGVSSTEHILSDTRTHPPSQRITHPADVSLLWQVR